MMGKTHDGMSKQKPLKSVYALVFQKGNLPLLKPLQTVKSYQHKLTILLKFIFMYIILNI